MIVDGASLKKFEPQIDELELKKHCFVERSSKRTNETSEQTRQHMVMVLVMVVMAFSFQGCARIVIVAVRSHQSVGSNFSPEHQLKIL